MSTPFHRSPKAARKAIAHLPANAMRKSGSERLEIGCQMADSARALVWSGIPEDLPEAERKTLFLQRFYGKADPTVAAMTGRKLPDPENASFL
jgi:hypothetical protein